MPRWPRTADPTPEEIAAEAARIRENWSEAEHFKRAGLLPPWWTVDEMRYSHAPPWTPPVVRCGVAVHAEHDSPW